MAAPPTETTSSSATPTFVPQGKHAGKPALPIGRAFTMIGSRSKAHLHLLSSSVSKAHAVIVNDAGNLYIRDTASREHVIVNGQPLRETDLRHGDQVKLGSFSFRFVDMTGKSGRVIPDPAPQAALEIEGEALPILFEGRTILIGRRPGSDVLLKEAAVSNVHAIIFELNHQHYIRDLGSRTGTFVNGEAIHNQPLKFNDVIRVGDTEMRFVPTGVPSNLDELEHLIGTSKLGAETQALASIDAARYTGAAPAPELPAAQSYPAAPVAPVVQAPQRITAAPPIQPPQHFTATPVAPQAPQRFTAAPAIQAPQRFTAPVAAQAPQAPRQYTAPPPPQAPQRFTALPVANSKPPAAVDKVNLDADLDVSGSDATKAIPVEGLGETARTPVLSSQVVDSTDEIELEEMPIPLAPATPHVADAPSNEDAELDLAFAEHQLSPAADVHATGDVDDFALEFAPVAADESAAVHDEHALHVTSNASEFDLAPAAEDHATHGESHEPATLATEDELALAADDHILHGENHASDVHAAEDELALAAEDHISHGESHEAPVGAPQDELSVTAHDHLLQAAGPESVTGAAATEHDLGLAADEDIFDIPSHESETTDWLTTEESALPIGVEPIEHAGLGALSGDAPAPAFADEEAERLLNLPVGSPVPPAFGVAKSPGSADGPAGMTPSDDVLPFPLIPDARSTADATSASASAEVIAPTDPSPESAQHLETQLDHPGSGVGHTLKVDELSDSTFGRAVQEFTGSALGSLIEHHHAAPLPEGATGDPIVDDALAFLAHENGDTDIDLGLDFDNLTPEAATETGESEHAITTAESVASTSEEQLDSAALGLDFDNHAPEQATETGEPEHAIATAESIPATTEEQLDAEALGLDFANLAPEETIEPIASDGVTMETGPVEDAATTAPLEPEMTAAEFVELENAAIEEPHAAEVAEAPEFEHFTPDELERLENLAPAPIAGEELEWAVETSPAEIASTEEIPLASIEALGEETPAAAPGEAPMSEHGLPEDLIDWDFEDLTLPEATTEAESESETSLTAIDGAVVEELAAEDSHFDATETAEAAPLDDAEAAKMLSEPGDSAPFELGASAADGLEGFDDLPSDAAPHDHTTTSPSAHAETAFTVSDDLNVSPAERAELFETGAPPPAPSATPAPSTPGRITLTAQEALAASEQLAASPAVTRPAPVAPPARPAPDPFFGMSRDFGSFLGGVPLGVPTQSMSPPPQLIAPPPPRRPAPMFGDTPVSLVMRQDDRSPQPHVSRAQLLEVEPPAARRPAPVAPPLPAPAARIAPPAAPPPMAPAPIAPAPVAPAPIVSAPDVPHAISPAPSEPPTPHSPLPTSPAAEPWDEELPELADLAPDLFKDEIEAPAAEVEAFETEPHAAPVEEHWHAEPQMPEVVEESQFDDQEPVPPTPAVVEELEAPELIPPPPRPPVREVPPTPPTSVTPPIAKPATTKPSPSPALKKPAAPAPATNVAKGLAGPLKSAGSNAKPSASPGASASSTPAGKPPARAPLKPRKSAPGLTGMGNPTLPSVDVFSQLPVDPDGGASIPQVTARSGFIPPGSESSRRPPGGGFRPPAPRKAGDPPPAARSGRATSLPAKPTVRKPVIAEGMEEVAEQLPLPSEELLQQEPLELPPEQAAEPEKKKKKWKFPFLKMVLLGLTAGGAAGAWHAFPPRSDLVATMKFDGIKDLDARRHAEFALAQAHAIDTAEFRKIAQAIYESDFHGRNDGFLSGNTEADTVAYPVVVDSVRSRGDQLSLQRAGARDVQEDSDRLRAMLKALYGADLAIAQKASAELAAREAAKAQLNQMTQRMEQLQKRLLEDQKKKADFELAQLKVKDLSDRSAMLEKALTDASDAVEKSKSQVKETTAVAAIPPKPVDDDAEVKRLLGKLADVKAVLAAAQPAPNGTPPNAKETLDVSLHQLKQEIDEMGAVQASAKLEPYLGVVRKVDSDIIQSNAERVERQRVAQQTLADIKRSLAEKTAAHLDSTWKMDGRLVQLDQDLAVERHRLGAATGAGLTGEVDRIRGRINELNRLIQTRRDEIAQAAPSTDEIRSLQKAFSAQIDQMNADASQHDRRVAAQFKLLDEAPAPQIAMPPEQQPLLDRLTTKVAAVNTARQLVAFSSPAGAPDLNALTAQVSAAQSQLDVRRKQVADDAEKTRQAAADALAKSQASLDSAQQAATKAAADVVAAKKDVADAQAAVAAVQSAPEDLARDNAGSLVLGSEIDKLKGDIGRQPAIAILTPLNPQSDDLVQITPIRNYRNEIVAGCGAFGAILLIWIFAGLRRRPEAAPRGRRANPSLDVRVPNFPHRPAAA